MQIKKVQIFNKMFEVTNCDLKHFEVSFEAHLRTQIASSNF